MKAVNMPMIICSNHSIEEGYTKANPISVQALKVRFLEIPLIEPIDLENIHWVKAVDNGKEEEIIVSSDSE